MNGTLLLVGAALLGYALGSIPTAYLVVRGGGQDIFAVGNRNPGAANVFRVVGRGQGVLVLLGDAGKGTLAVALADLMGVDGAWRLVPGAAAVLGHLHSLFLGFRGGGGLATTVGVSLAIIPWPGFLGAVPGLLALGKTHNTGWAAGLGYAVALVLGSLFGYSLATLLGVLLLAVAVMVRANVVDWWARRPRRPTSKE